MAKEEEGSVLKVNPTDPAAVKPGDLLAITYYTKVIDNNRYAQTLRVTDVDRSTPFTIQGDELIKAATTADRFTEEVKLSRTKICDILTEHCWGVPFTVCFVKKGGDERVLRGRYVEWEKQYGRSLVTDLDLPLAEGPRQVDHRTIKWLIVRGTKYVSSSRN